VASAPHIHFIVMELLKNAIEATVKHHGTHAKETAKKPHKHEHMPPILIDVKESGPYIGFRVRDRGGGISPAIRERIFDYFYTSAPPVEPTYTYGGTC